MTITAPPCPPRPNEPDSIHSFRSRPPEDPHALIEEARARAKRRRRRYGACAASIAAAGVLLVLSIGRGGAGATVTSGAPKPLGTQPPASPSGRLAIGGIDGTTVVNGNGTNLRVLRAPRSQVAFSPDGSELAYLRGDGWIVTRNLATDRTRLIVRLGSQAWAYPRWSPDGRSLAYAFGIVPGPATIAAIDRDGSNRHVVATDASVYFHWSPGGEWIAYWGTTITKLWLVRPDGGDRHLAISGMSPVGGFGQPDFSWSADGGRIAFIARSPSGFGVVTERIDGTDRRPIVSGRSVFEPQWSPDGRSIAYLRGGKLIVRQLASGAETAIATRARAEQWSPDGRWIAYIRGIDGSIMVVSRAGTARHQVAKVRKAESIVWGSSQTP